LFLRDFNLGKIFFGLSKRIADGGGIFFESAKKSFQVSNGGLELFLQPFSFLKRLSSKV
jgi:hypothetical protein